MLLHEITATKYKVRSEFDDYPGEEESLRPGPGFYVIYPANADLGKLIDPDADPTIQARLAKTQRSWYGDGPFETYRRAHGHLEDTESDDAQIIYGKYDGSYLTPEKAPED